MINVTSEDSIDDLIENMIIEFLKAFGDSKESEITKFIWKNAIDVNLYLDHIPNEEAKVALNKLIQRNQVTFDETTGLYHFNEISTIYKQEEFNSKWHLRVMGNYLLKSSKLLPIDNIKSEFNKLEKFVSRVLDDFSLKCTWKKEGITSILYLEDNGDFRISVHFSTQVHPELIENDILLQTAKYELMKTGLSTGFFMMHSACKKVLSEILKIDIAIINSYELLENSEVNL